MLHIYVDDNFSISSDVTLPADMSYYQIVHRQSFNECEL